MLFFWINLLPCWSFVQFSSASGTSSVLKKEFCFIKSVVVLSGTDAEL